MRIPVSASSAKQEPVPGVFGGREHGNEFFGGQRAWRQPRHHAA